MESSVTALKMAILYNRTCRKITLVFLVVFASLVATLSYSKYFNDAAGAPQFARSSKMVPRMPRIDLKAAALDHSSCPLDKKFKVYLYNSNDRRIFAHLNDPNERTALLLESLESSLKQKNMWADSPEDACAFIVLLRPFLQTRSSLMVRDPESDLANLLWSLPHWVRHGAGGRNHFVVDLLESSMGGARLFDLVDIGDAIPVSNYVTDSPTNSILAPPIQLGTFHTRHKIPTGEVSNTYSNVENIVAAVNATREYSSILPLHRKHLFYFEGGYMKSDHHDVEEEKTLLSLIQNTASYLSASSNIQLLSECMPSALPAWNGEWKLCSVEKSRLRQCTESTFSLVLGPISSGDRPGPSTYLRLVDSLRCGSIPVIIGLDRLPFDDVVDWQKAALVFPWALWQDALRTAAAMDSDVIMERRKQGKFLLHSYFNEPALVFDATVAVIRNRFLHPPPMAEDFAPSILKRSGRRQTEQDGGKVSSQYSNYALNMRERVWNSPPGPHFVYPVSPFRPLSYRNQMEERRMPLPNSVLALMRVTDEDQVKEFLKMNRLDVLKRISTMPEIMQSSSRTGSSKNIKKKMQHSRRYEYSKIAEKYTVVTLTHHRDEQIANLVTSLGKCPFLHKIVIVWNNEYPVPEAMALPELGIPIEVVSAGRNSLNNRFLPLSNIETEAVLTLDDDTVLTCDDVELGFRIWRENQQSIVGWTSRVHGRDPGGSWSYSFANVCERSMVITNAAFFHKYYSYLYTYWMPAEIREIVDLFMNCEDIAMNFLVSHISGRAMVKVGKKRSIAVSSCKTDLQSGLSCLSSNHLLERDFCLNAFADYYGYVPLIYSITRTEPLHLKLDSNTYDWCDKYRDSVV